MWIVTILVLLAGGLLGASGIIIGKRPDAKQWIDKLVPYQGIIGIVMLIWGLWDAFHLLRSLSLFAHAPFWWLVFLVTTLTELGLGFLLGYGLIVKYVVGNRPEAVAKAEQVHARLRAYQGPLGLAAIVLAVVFLVLNIAR